MQVPENQKRVIRKFGHEIIQIHNSHNVITLWPLACIAIFEVKLTFPIREKYFSDYRRFSAKYAKRCQHKLPRIENASRVFIGIM